jgi:hypothetical protein
MMSVAEGAASGLLLTAVAAAIDSSYRPSF